MEGLNRWGPPRSACSSSETVVQQIKWRTTTASCCASHEGINHQRTGACHRTDVGDHVDGAVAAGVGENHKIHAGHATDSQLWLLATDARPCGARLRQLSQHAQLQPRRTVHLLHPLSAEPQGLGDDSCGRPAHGRRHQPGQGHPPALGAHSQLDLFCALHG